MERQRKYSRRTLLRAGGAGVVALTAGVVGGRTYAEGPERLRTGDFDLNSRSRILAPSRLRHTTVPQSFAFDDTRDDIYAVQLLQGGLRLRDEPRRLTSDERARRGDLCVNRLSANGRRTGHMMLRGFGHGVSIAVEPTGSGVLLWTESQAHPRTGYGRAITRFPFRDGAVLDSGHSALRHHRPVPGSLANQPAIDLAGRRVMVGYWTVPSPGEREQWYAVYDMDDFLAGRYEPLHTVRPGRREPDETFQGCVLHGNYVYQLAGDAYTSPSGGNPPKSGGNTRVDATDLRSGRTTSSRRTTVAGGLDHREPEGLAVRLTDGPRLCVGFATGDRGDRMLAVHAFERV